ncbi:autoinducer binding domain-containing protein (plasmid) [Aminobacter sp. SR38]|uniref:helix-turn-helix transcriptional regulator n=1 Tax=Aminobacter sp. SR38 TaxID=2774562 RepID=UPI00177ADA87|nr:LuxR family transcriptional regulator [Aminobacter sp. SR38]QOF75463.1 autoinducer binding domain-containing protein [Aminobacter sp. SR38]
MRLADLSDNLASDSLKSLWRPTIQIEEERQFLRLAQASWEILHVKTTAEVLTTLQRHLERYGFSDLLITGLPVFEDQDWRRQILCDGWRQEWYCRYVEQGHFEHDPCVAQCRRSAFPFLWGDLQPELMSPRAKLVMDEARDFSMKEGLCVPVHIPLHGPAVVTAAGDRVEVPPSDRPLVEALCLNAFQAICRLEGRLDRQRQRILGPREAEVLQWCAEGKAAEDIAIILSVSKFTVQAHQRHIREKLGANNISQAIVKALVLGEIQVIALTKFGYSDEPGD